MSENENRGDANGVIEKIKKYFSKSTAFSGTDKKLTECKAAAEIQTPYGKKLNIGREEKIRLISSLTQREKSTFLLLLEGYTLKETACRMGIGYSTANTYQTAVYRKLNVNSRAELIINYLDAGGQKSGES